MKRVGQLILFVLLLFLLYWRLQVSVARFFDVDEFTYIHWVARTVAGERPYIDFFFLIPPGFLWLMRPIVGLFWDNPAILIVSRLMMLGMFVVLLALLGKIFSLLRVRTYALLSVVILAFLPMPYDKFLEVRPDNPMTLLAITGVLFGVKALLDKKTRGVYWFWSGFFYGASLLVLPKTLPMVAIAAIVCLWLVFTGHSWRATLAPFVLGLVVPLLPFGLWLLISGSSGVVWYSLTKLAFEANGIGRYYIMEPHLFFFPNSAFYGGPGITGELLVNHAVWLLGIILGLVRLFTPWVTSDGDRKRAIAELLVAGSFFAMVASYVQFFPLKHSQYLIPIAVFVSFYVADGIVMFLGWFARRARDVVVPAVLLIFSLLVVVTTLGINEGKLGITNRVQIEQMRQLIGLIPPQSHVFDLEGRLMFWKNSYPICCLPMGQFLPLLSHPPPPIAMVLEADKTQYIFQGDTGRLTFLQPNDLAYIKAYYQQVPGWGDRLWQRK